MNIKVPVSWLRDYLKTDVAAKTIATVLSLSGPSVEKTEKRQDDYIFDIEVTTNRPDAFSIFGIAREANTILRNEGEKSNLTSPQGMDLNLDPDVSALLPLDVIIKDHTLCPRFSAIIIDNVKIKPSPALIQNRLEACGIRPINNIVDISNYLMLELGQPMHTFDYDKIKNHKMLMRTSKDGEKIKTLDGSLRKLPKGAIVIEDDKRLIDLCGIMGGENTQISKRTKRVILFVQAYNSLLIRKTTQKLAFRTEAAARFEKGTDLEGIIPALSRAVYLAKKNAGAKIASELIDIFPQKPMPTNIVLDFSKLDQYLGIKIEKSKAEAILKSLGFKTELQNQTICAKPPSWRTGDIEEDVDLIEEIARIYGYHRLPSKIPQGQIPQIQDSLLKETIKLKEKLKYLGLAEIISYSIISKDFLNLTQTKKEKIVELANPLSVEWQFLRPTILISLIDAIAKNQNFKKDLGVFEIAKTYLGQRNDLPSQDLMLEVAIQSGDFYQIKGLVENIFEEIERKEKWVKLASPNPLFESDQATQIKIADETVGFAGFVNFEMNKYFKIEEPLVAAQLNLTRIYAHPPQTKIFKNIPKYPAVIEDLSIVVAKESQVDDVLSQIKKAGGSLVKKIEVIDIFFDSKLGINKKSLTFRITYQKPQRTPTQEEVTREREKIIESLQKSLRAQIRR